MSHKEQTTTMFEESAIVEPLRAKYPAFRHFYDATRPHIPGAIVWKHDPTVRTEAKADMYTIYHTMRGAIVGRQTVYRAIRFPRRPVTTADAQLMAHELQHLRLEAEGWPGIGFNHEEGHLPAAMQSMVEDLLVHPALIEAGFDVQASIEAEWTRARDQLEAIEAPPPNTVTALLWIVNFASHLLDYHILAQHKPGYPEPVFFAWADYTYPALMTEARDLARMVVAFGYDQPVKMERLYTMILQRYDLTDLYFVA